MAEPDWQLAFDVGSAGELQGLAERLAEHLAPGDLLVLSGELGAGKTTFTQGLGRGLAVEDRIISPTFVLVREHGSTTAGPGLIHVDAYRLESAAAIDDLDLEATLARNVTVIEWGAGRVEHLSDSRLHIDIIRPRGGGEPGGDPGGPPATPATRFDDDAEDEVRSITLAGFGPRWRAGPPALRLD
ncbi:tRNA (adenosine(37)-N6)-threonylcarbamoyltransferase complex ATPase subunit type 1 TsaE [Arthrobacter agilis]|uniref:tRNA (adenosine(37)-N6)-threonylcarbamoyltransferase complex ATPase subunit type 1 TsaE n=1 Tax=Arthrobacter agilis TaxID=37921 RepID=UPI00236539D9|nr:tRNA (adenosine(37)-N6)-threonylcarbamoyltransferase complex ATPase subunit type 1 TsaE [Arthrobacter agilis]WDF32598.1 tRNA (adenosine(37)-N6)-threonylcarbamoyltransferase complex ATPase subunit type 1 TsaE [Arthrobacter agilis]